MRTRFARGHGPSGGLPHDGGQSGPVYFFFSFSREREIGEMFVNDGNERIIEHGPGYDIMEENNI